MYLLDRLDKYDIDCIWCSIMLIYVRYLLEEIKWNI